MSYVTKEIGVVAEEAALLHIGARHALPRTAAVLKIHFVLRAALTLKVKQRVVDHAWENVHATMLGLM